MDTLVPVQARPQGLDTTTARFAEGRAAGRARPRRGCVTSHHRIHLATTEPTAFVDITGQLEQLVAASQLRTGILNLQTLHTTTAVIVNEHEPLLLGDFRNLLERAAPRAAAYAHDDPAIRTVNLSPGERPNGHAHCQALLMPSTVCLNVAGGRLELGTWQRVFFVELDGPRHRELSVLVVGEALR